MELSMIVLSNVKSYVIPLMRRLIVAKESSTLPEMVLRKMRDDRDTSTLCNEGKDVVVK
jgi:hypothetical protein